MFVGRHQHAEVERRQAVDKQAVARAVAWEFFCGARRSRSSWGRVANSICTSSKVLPFISASAWGEGIGNGKAVLAVVAIDCGHGDDEINGNQTRTLV